MTEPRMNPDYFRYNGAVRITAEVLRKHPLPWTIDRDWSHEVHAADGKVVAKSTKNGRAEDIIHCAEALDQNTVPTDPNVIDALMDVVFWVFLDYSPPWKYDPVKGELFASDEDGTLIATGLTDYWAKVLCRWAHEKREELDRFKEEEEDEPEVVLGSNPWVVRLGEDTP